jgi:hypothetical protein
MERRKKIKKVIRDSTIEETEKKKEGKLKEKMKRGC